MSVTGRDHRLTYSQSLIAGALGGASSRTLTAPLDILKTLHQVGAPNARGGLIHTALNLCRQEGLRSLWKGNLVGCSRLVPHSVMQFAVYQNMKMTLADDLGKVNATSLVASSSVAGLTATTLTYPMDLVKTRLMVQPLDKRQSAYKGMTDAVRTIVKKEGVFTLWRGLSLNLFGTFPYATMTFLSYLIMESITTKPSFRKTATDVFLQGCVAAGVSLTVCFPFDTIRRKLQAASRALPDNGGVDVKFSNIPSAFKQTIQKNGYRGLWRGLVPALMRVCPYNGFMLAGYEVGKRFFLYQNGYSNAWYRDTSDDIDQNTHLEDLREDDGDNNELALLMNDLGNGDDNDSP